MNAVLALEDGTWFRGTSVGAAGETSGEVVFNTSMTGYQEILTDPSYAGQIVTMTSVQIGNYGVTADDTESRGPQVAGFVMRESSPVASNWRADQSLRDYLVKHNIVAIADVDTRALTRKLRSGGVLRGVIATGPNLDPQQLVERANRIRHIEGTDLVREVTCETSFEWRAAEETDPEFLVPPERRAARRLKIAAYDFGIKHNILRRLAAHNCDVSVFPASAPASDLLAIEPDGVFLSNGPGDPAALSYAVDNARQLVKADVPVFGICLGHQLLATALGGATVKLPFGHHGANHPVQDVTTGKIEITSQNHNFAVSPDGLAGVATLTHVNLNDGVCEGLEARNANAFSVQHHPEAGPGPHDSSYLFDRFAARMSTSS
jgi:carbamoyl-phosphate synthase small subunit